VGNALRVGLTGGIASGKSTVAGLLARAGAQVIDADGLAHGLMEPGGATHGPIVERFGRDLLDREGRIDRERLGRLVFADRKAREALNAIVHPLVRQEIERRIGLSPGPIVVVDAALLVETGSYRDFDRLIVVRCSPETQRRRLRERDGLTEAEARARLDAQADVDRKVAVADYVIDTDGTLEQTRQQTERVHADLRRDHDTKFGP
jgi:dephospho-CoA kinase